MAVSAQNAPVRALELPTPKGLFWFDRKNCWSSKIGYHYSKAKDRVRSQQYYPAAYTLQGLKWAEKQFMAKRGEWALICQQTDSENEQRKQMFPEGFVPKLPVWPVKSAAKVTSSEPAPIKVIGDQPKYADPTIEVAKDRHIATLLGRTKLVGDRNLKPGSYNTEKQALRLALSPHKDDQSGNKPIDTTLRLSQITLSVLTAFHSYWHSSDLDLSRRSRKNYCLAFWKLLNNLANDDAFDFNLPKGAATLFRFGGDTANIAAYDPEQLKLIKAKSPERTWTYCLLALNGGMYQDDISQIQVGTTVVQLDPKADKKKLKIGEVVRLENGKPIPLTRKELKVYDGSYDLYVSRIRNRTAHKYPYPALHWLFPEAAMALAKHVADDNQWDFALLGKSGRPLMVKEANKSPFVPLNRAYNKVMAKIKKAGGKAISFKQFRKIGVSELGRLGNDTVVRLYRSQPPLGDAAMYQLDDYETKLTPHLRAWRDKLVADGVL